MKKDWTGIIRKVTERSTSRTALVMMGAELLCSLQGCMWCWAKQQERLGQCPRGTARCHTHSPPFPDLWWHCWSLLPTRSSCHTVGMEECWWWQMEHCAHNHWCISLHENCKFFIYALSRKDLSCCTRPQSSPYRKGEFCWGSAANSCRWKHRRNSMDCKPFMHRSRGFPSLQGVKHRDGHSCPPHAGQGREALSHNTTELLYPCHSRAQRYASQKLGT